MAWRRLGQRSCRHASPGGLDRLVRSPAVPVKIGDGAGEHVLDEEPLWPPVAAEVVEESDGDDVGPRVIGSTSGALPQGGEALSHIGTAHDGTGVQQALTASKATSVLITSRAMPVACADSTSALLNPKFHSPDAGRGPITRFDRRYLRSRRRSPPRRRAGSGRAAEWHGPARQPGRSGRVSASPFWPGQAMVSPGKPGLVAAGIVIDAAGRETGWRA